MLASLVIPDIVVDFFIFQAVAFTAGYSGFYFGRQAERRDAAKRPQ